MVQLVEALQTVDLTVSFSGNVALNSVDILVAAGGLVGLVGENGARKSTLLNVLSGIIWPDRGRTLVHGKMVELRTPRDAINAGIFRVHQEQALIGRLTVAENLVLGLDRQFRLGPVVARQRMKSHAQKVLDELGLEYDVNRLLGSYSFGARQMIELARVVAAIDALEVSAPVVLLDEPTAALSAPELQAFDRYLGILHSTRNASIVLVSHRLDEIITLCDERVVLKDGSVVATVGRSSSVDELHKLMVGRERAADFYIEDQQRMEFGERVVEVDNISIGYLKSASLAIRQGEIVGIAGLPRSGKHELGAAVFGASRNSAGNIRLFGQRAAHTLRARINHGLGYIPLHRDVEGISLGMSVRDNIASASWSDWSRWGVRRPSTESRIARDLVNQLSIRTTGITQRTGSLSGGNQQKVVFARWVARKMKILVADNVYWKGMNRGAEAAATALGIGFTNIAYSDSIAAQLAATESAGSKGVTQILMFAQNAAGSVKLTETAANQKIPVVNYITAAPWSTPLEPGYKGYYTALLTPNDVADADAMCSSIFKRLGGSGKIINLSGIPGNPTATGRMAGVDSALKKFPGIEMVARQNGGENRVAAQPVIENLLTAHPDVQAVVCHNDDSAIAVLNALRDRGMKDVLVGGNDALQEFLEAIVSGPNAAVTIAIHGEWLGGYGVVRAFDALQGVKFNPVERMQYHEALSIDTKDSAQAYIDLVYKAPILPYDYAGMSQALNKDSWNPEVYLDPIDPRKLWDELGYKKPAGYTLPAEYLKPLDGPDFQEQRNRYHKAVTKSPLDKVVQLTTSKKTVLG